VIVGLVCARAGSQGLPGKNLLKLGGRMLIELAMDKARATCDRVLISTDIPLSSIDIGDDTYINRPVGLCGPRVPKWDVWKHAAGEIDNVTAIVDIDVTRPLTTVEDITGTIKAARNGAPADLWDCRVAAMWRGQARPACDVFARDTFDCFNCVAEPEASRQDAGEAWGYGGVYFVGIDALRLYDEMWPAYGNEIPRAHCFDIDDALDWEIVQDQYKRQAQDRFTGDALAAIRSHRNARDSEPGWVREVYGPDPDREPPLPNPGGCESGREFGNTGGWR